MAPRLAAGVHTGRQLSEHLLVLSADSLAGTHLATLPFNLVTHLHVFEEKMT